MSIRYASNATLPTPITSISEYGKVRKNYLVMHLDAGNVKSYPGSGTTWYDLTGNGYNATLNGTISHTSGTKGYFDYAGSQTSAYVTLDENALNTHSLSGYYWTIDMWLRLDSTSGTTYFNSMATTSDSNFYIVVKDGNALYPYNTSKLLGSNITFTAGELFNLTIVRRFSGFYQYQYWFKNGRYYGMYAAGNFINNTEGWILNQEQDSVKGTFDSGQATDMGIYQIKLYSAPLYGDEIVLGAENRLLNNSVYENHAAQRGRYGL